MKKLKEELKYGNKGITLISLVVTIIILLILAGIAIASLTGENGLFARARQAREETLIAQEDELRRLTMLEAAANLENQPYTDKNGDTATIPAGFAVSQVEGENTIADGLVIIDKNGNEFVWVPVEITEEEKQTGVTFETKYPRTTFVDNKPTGSIDTTTYTEPYEDGYEGEDTEYQAMIDSVTKHGGFYVGRYEAGFEGNEPRSEENQIITQKVVSKKGAYVYNWVPWGSSMSNTGPYNGITGAVELSKNFAEENGYDTNEVTSTLIYGIQWDMMLRYVADEEHNVIDSSSWGNYSDSIGDAAANSGEINMNFTTGRNESWKAKNIYDIAGNIQEWTMESYDSTIRVTRGGDYRGSSIYSPVSVRYYSSPYNRYGHLGFRITLYIK